MKYLVLLLPLLFTNCSCSITTDGPATTLQINSYSVCKQILREDVETGICIMGATYERVVIPCSAVDKCRELYGKKQETD